jgi:hypothetical protein
MARARRGGVTTHRVQRSLAAMTVNAQRAYRAHDEQQRELSGGETELQFKSSVSGTAGAIAAYDYVNVSFPRPIVAALDRRDSQFDRPLFTYGWERLSGPPLFLTAFVDRWRTSADSDELCIGARVGIGAVTPGSLDVSRFTASVHLIFQGWAAQDLNDDLEGTT